MATGCAGYREAFSRRSFLQAGLAGVSLPSLLKARELSGQKKDTAVIQYWLGGAASHIETYDPKPDAPADYRGPFRTIRTNVPGTMICETLPGHARMMDKVAIVRSVRHNNSDHQHGMHWCLTGHFPTVNPFKASSHPSSGSVAARFRGSNHPDVMPYVHMGYPLDRGGGRMLPHEAAVLGQNYDPFVTLNRRTGDGKDPGLDRNFRVRGFDIGRGLTAATLAERQTLLGRLDRLRRRVDGSGEMQAMDRFQHTAFDMLTGGRAQAAFDLDREDPRVRDRYGHSRPGQTALLARRLVEAGVTFVNVIDPGVGLSSSGWDLHTRLEWGMNKACPRMDRAVTALIEDLYQRGLDRKVLLVVWGEFGRTPRINKNGGRDHWADVQSVLFAGGGMRMGQVIGASTAKGEEAKDRILWPYDVIATMYHHLGIDPEAIYTDNAGRPLPVLAEGEAISELI